MLRNPTTALIYLQVDEKVRAEGLLPELVDTY